LYRIPFFFILVLIQFEEIIEMIDIASELKLLWETQSSAKRMKASLFNLIIYTQKVHRSDYFEAIIQSVVDQFPCRIFFVEGDNVSDTDLLKTQITAKTMASTGETVYCDMISIKASGPSLDKVPFLLLPHILPDLPVYLLWGQDPRDECRILSKLQGFADRLIFDAESTDNLQRFAVSVLDTIESNKHTVIDLNWIRLNSWRQVLSQVLHKRRTLELCQTLEISYNSCPSQAITHCDFQALYLQGWLASQLNWEMRSLGSASTNTSLINYAHAFGTTQVKLIPKKRDNLPAGVIIDVKITSANSCQIDLERIGDSRRVKVSVSSKKSCTLPQIYTLSGDERNQQIIKDTFFNVPSKHYPELLNTLSLKKRSKEL
jgi:glucose-6-phosphate dehydrogenase assembly protein OpcA